MCNPEFAVAIYCGLQILVASLFIALKTRDYHGVVKGSYRQSDDRAGCLNKNLCFCGVFSFLSGQTTHLFDITVQL